MEEEKIIDQSLVAESVAEKIPYDFVDSFLVKPLDPIKVMKQFNKPVEKDTEAKADENGVVAKDYDVVDTEIKEVNSDYRKGVVIKIPHSFKNLKADDHYTPYEIKVGDVILYKDAPSYRNFDLVKDTVLIKYYEIVAKECVND